MKKSSGRHRARRTGGRAGGNSSRRGASSSASAGAGAASTTTLVTVTAQPMSHATLFKEIRSFYYSDSSEYDTETEHAMELAQCQHKVLNAQFCCGCFFPVKTEIYTCRNGHYVCNVCSYEKRCPDCRVMFKRGLYRNVGLEKLMIERIDCPYKTNGCNERVLKIALSKHLIGCRFSKVGYLLCNLLGYKECDFAGCPSEITEFVEHMMMNHEGRFYANAGIDRIAGVRAILTESLEKHQLFMWDVTILSAADEPERDMNGNLLPSRQNYFLVCGGCNADIFFYTCIHMGPGMPRKVKEFEITVQILSHDGEIPHFEIKPKIMDVSIASCLNGWSQTFEFPLEHGWENYFNSEGELIEVVYVSRKKRNKFAAPTGEPSEIPKTILKSVELETPVEEIDSSDSESLASTLIIPGRENESRPDSPDDDLSDSPADAQHNPLDSSDEYVDVEYITDEDSSNWETYDDSDDSDQP